MGLNTPSDLPIHSQILTEEHDMQRQSLFEQRHHSTAMPEVVDIWQHVTQALSH